MPAPMVRSQLGPPLGDPGLLPLLIVLLAVGARVVAVGPYTLPILKGCLRTFTRVSGRTAARRGAIHLSNITNSFNVLFLSNPDTMVDSCRARGTWPRTADKRGHAAHSGGIAGAPSPSRRVPSGIRHNPQESEGSARHSGPPTSAASRGGGGVEQHQIGAIAPREWRHSRELWPLPWPRLSGCS